MRAKQTPASTSLKLMLSAAAASFAAGCLIPPEGPGGQSVWRPDHQAPINREIALKVQESTHILHARGGRLARGEAARLGAFLSAHGTPWSMDIRVQPLSSDGAAAMGDTASALIQLGVQRNRISALAYAAAAAAAGDGDIAVVARHVKASAVNCPDWRRSNLMDLSHLNSSNFGCATADHLARMVADPRDLASGRALSPAEGGPASAAIERYRTDKIKPLPKRDGGGGGAGGGGGGGGN